MRAATPSVAIGSYDATPLQVAGAYTIFANGGVHLEPWMLASVRTLYRRYHQDYSPNVKDRAGSRASPI